MKRSNGTCTNKQTFPQTPVSPPTIHPGKTGRLYLPGQSLKPPIYAEIAHVVGQYLGAHLGQVTPCG